MSEPGTERPMPFSAPHPRTRLLALFEFEALESLPCGCVAAWYRTLDPGLSVVSLEAKGPHCLLLDHAIGQVVAVPFDAQD